MDLDDTRERFWTATGESVAPEEGWHNARIAWDHPGTTEELKRLHKRAVEAAWRSTGLGPLIDALRSQNIEGALSALGGLLGTTPREWKPGEG